MMKKIFLVVAALISATILAQKGHPFVSGAIAALHAGQVPVALEVGRFASPPFFYSATIAGLPKERDWYVGGKGYYLAPTTGKWALFLYSNPQWALNRPLFVMEDGGGVNYSLADNIFLSYSFGVQNSKEGNTELISACFTYLFKKK